MTWGLKIGLQCVCDVQRTSPLLQTSCELADVFYTLRGGPYCLVREKRKEAGGKMYSWLETRMPTTSFSRITTFSLTDLLYYFFRLFIYFAIVEFCIVCYLFGFI